MRLELIGEKKRVGPDRSCPDKKIGEEATETVIAALTGDEAELVGEAADLLFHLMVLLAEKGVPLGTVLAELDRREGTSGIAEKASRTE